MPRNEWGELERVSSWIDELQERRGLAEKTGNLKRAQVLDNELRAAQRERTRLVDRIVSCLAEAG